MVQQASASRAIPSERNTFMYVDLAVFLLGFGKGVRTRTSVDPQHRRESQCQVQNRIPKSRGIITRIVQHQSGMLREMAIIFGMGTRTGNNLQSVRKELARSCKLARKTGGKSLQDESPVMPLKEPILYSSSTSVSGS